ncbi:pitrilysin family protein [Brevibacillus formosus]|uniref:EF-P 5-aminopentanol modification-associated protein YfmF n=1 Tax=Brevibacillus TaxID=55080 RepID=UPI000D0F413B|nr:MULTISPECIES: pitrilysin family protein [Brevibacillus]MBG9945176.1 peptidase [Brevibacillus formosus]MED1943517.1 pitrilysin family protein [Brevibacillus formosus]MED2000111.1 pitrilysin family protein [Brevibacillus formosus]MED2081752.1 pitrilysin family protein [Brevibacillus formosus]PSK19299.1 insulinase family protein [Brevibacillus sp. NRRL NRS-603]
MTATTTEIAFQSSQINGMNVHILPTEKFKTTTIVTMIEQALSEEHVTKTALLAMVMKRASARFPETKLLRAHLDFLYGAIFDVDVMKKGERQILQIYMEVPNEKYLSNEASLLEQAIEFVGDMLVRPYVQDNAFSEKYLAQEKETLRKRIESLIDDKMKYANQRVTEEMCKGEPFSLLVQGRVADLPKITGQELYQYFKEVTTTNPINMFVVGDVDQQEVSEAIRKHIPLERSQAGEVQIASTAKDVSAEREVIDRLDVNQAKLNIGCRTQITYKDDDYPALLLFNGILGGFPHSKLFVNVREKESLAYYAVSRLESHKGILMIMSGIDVSKYQRAVEIIKQQLDLMQQGTISDEEMSQTRATLSNQFRELLDSARGMIDFTYNGVISGRPRKIEELLAGINQATIEDIKKVASKVTIDTVYLLRDKKGEA